MIINDLFNNKKQDVAEGRFVRGPGGVPLDRQGRPVAPKAPKAEPMRMRQWVVHHEGQRGEGGEMTVDAPNLETAWELANEYDLDIIDIKPVKGMAEGSLNEFAITPDDGPDGKQVGRWLITYMIKDGTTKEKIMVGKNANAVSKYFEFKYRRKPLSVVPYFDNIDLRGSLGLDEQGMAEGSEESYIIIRTDAEGKKDMFAKFSTYEKAQKELDVLLDHPLHTKYKQKFEIKRKGGEQGVAEAYQFKGGFPFDVDHMNGPRGINLPSVETKKYFTDKQQWAQAVDELNHSLYDDNSMFTGVTGRSTVAIDGREWARWSDAQQKGYVETKSLSQGMAEGSFDHWSPMGKDSIHQDRIRSLQNLIAIAKEQGRQLRVQELELALKKLQGVNEVSLGDYRKKAAVSQAGAKIDRFFGRDDAAKVAAADQTIAKREKGLARADARVKPYTPPKFDTEKYQRDLTAKYPNIDELVRKAELNRDPNYEYADGQAYYAARDAEQNYQKLRQIQRVIQGLNESLQRTQP